MENWPSIDVVIPARNEADMLPHSLPSLLGQDLSRGLRIFLVDDHSSDGTADAAEQIARTHPGAEMHILEMPEKPEGWNGKTAAMQAGLDHSEAPYILFTDADIYHPPDALRRLVARAVASELDLVSLMVRLRCRSAAEKLLIPAFVFFFAMLYPFRRANDPRSNGCRRGRCDAGAAHGACERRRSRANQGGADRSIARSPKSSNAPAAIPPGRSILASPRM